MKPSMRAKLSEGTVECWDDDEDFADITKVQSIKVLGNLRRGYRDSSSSRVSLSSGSHSLSSDAEFNDDFVLPDIASSRQSLNSLPVGIPISKDIPPTAFVGGAIKKLGSFNQRTSNLGDWGDDIDLPTENPLKLKNLATVKFPTSLSDHSSAEDSLSGFDKEDEDDIPTIRVPKKITPKPTIVGAFEQPSQNQAPPPPLATFQPSQNNEVNDRYDNHTLLTMNSKYPTTPPPIDQNDSDLDGSGEGSLGTRHAGRHRNRNNSVSSILSPSVSSSFTFDSEDENFGLEIPESTFNFRDALEQKKQTRASEVMASLRVTNKTGKDDFLEGLDVGEGDIFKAPSNQNVKHKSYNSPLLSPSKINAMTLTFSQKHSQLQIARGGRRLSSAPLHTLEPVAEVSMKSPDLRNNKKDMSPTRSSRNLQNAVESRKQPTMIPTKTRASLAASDKQKSLRSQKSTPNLKTQGSAPVKLRQPLPPPLPAAMRIPRPSSRSSINSDHSDSPGRSGLHSLTYRQHPLSGLNPLLNRPSSRQDLLPTQLPRPSSRTSKGRPGSRTSQRSPSADRQSMHSRASNHGPSSRPSSRLSTHSKNGDRSRSPRRPRTPHDNFVPPVPTGASGQQPHHAHSRLNRPPQKSTFTQSQPENTRKYTSQKKKSSAVRPPTVIAPESLRNEAASTNTLRVPMRRRNFGNGTELEIFDDLPTMSKNNLRGSEKKLDAGTGHVLKSRRHSLVNGQRAGRSRSSSLNSNEGSSSIPTRERRVVEAPGNSSARTLRDNLDLRRSPRRHESSQQQKPRLIRGSDPRVAKAVQNMRYNPNTFRWEGNEHEAEPFDEGSGGLPTNLPRPALIASIKSAKNVQVVGKMVFDPTHMCWLKVDNTASDDEDVFCGIDDLDDGTSATPESTIYSGPSERFQDLVIAEEFDVGPAFVQRQHEEEERWRSKVHGWISAGEATSNMRAWDLRQIAISGYGLP